MGAVKHVKAAETDEDESGAPTRRTGGPGLHLQRAKPTNRKLFYFPGRFFP